MNVAGAITNLLKIVFLILLIFVILLGGIYWFDYLGLVDYRRLIEPYKNYLPSILRREVEVSQDPLLLEKEFLNKEMEILLAKEKELELTRKQLEEMELAIMEREAKLKEEAESLAEEKKVLSEKLREYDNYRENIRTQADYFINMPPEAAVERLSQLEDLLAIDIMRQIDKNADEEGRVSVVPYYLSLMDPAKAATLQRKMTKVGEYN
jgi:flagellar protein FlbB